MHQQYLYGEDMIIRIHLECSVIAVHDRGCGTHADPVAPEGRTGQAILQKRDLASVGIFDGEAKQQRRETVFPEERKQVYQLGAGLVK